MTSPARAAAALALLATLAGCKSGPREPFFVRIESALKKAEEEGIQAAKKGRPPLKTPVRIAVLELNDIHPFRGNAHFPQLAGALRRACSDAVKEVVPLSPVLLAEFQAIRIETPEKKMTIEMKKEPQKAKEEEPRAPEPAFLPVIFDIESLRLAGARMDADVVLLVLGDWQPDVSQMPWSILDLAIVPGLILPSTTVAIETRVHAYGIDVRSPAGAVVFSFYQEERDSSFVPSIWWRGRMETLRDRIADKIADRIGERTRDVLKGAAAAQPQ